MPTPYNLESEEARDLFAQLLLMYRGAEVALLSLVRDAVKQDQAGTAGHYQNRLRQTRRLRREAQKIMNQVDSQVDAVVQAIVQVESEHVAITTARAGAKETGKKTPTVKVNATATEVIAREIANTLHSIREPVLRTVDDIYRTTTAQLLVDSVEGGLPRGKRIQEGLNRYADKGITAFIDKAGRKWSMDTYVDMATRTGINRAQNEAKREGFAAAGVEMIIVSSHMGAHPWCLPYQGKVLAIGGGAGTRVVETATGDQIAVDVVATRDEAVAAGYQHINCRHTESAYIPGMPVPEALQSTEEDYELVQRQREIERHIRRWKRREATALTDEEASYAKSKVKFWQAEMREHVKKKPWLVRQYDREKIM